MDPEALMKSYFDFFKKKGHKLIESASLIPVNDASVLFNTAGMQPLVPYLLGQKHPYGRRLVNVQKCLRTVDFENIGDDTHNTFFQMLGNWSLGDYFKKEAIEWSFEFLTKVLNIPLKMLAFTVYKGDKDVTKDEESVKIWRSLGVPKERIAYVGKDNFWQAGDTGPCGPSTEMFYWAGNGEAPKVYDPQDNRWVEIWNDVFMAYDRSKRTTLLVDGMHTIYDEKFIISRELLGVVNSFGLRKILVVNGFRKEGEKLLSSYSFNAFSLEENGIKKDNPKFFETLLKDSGLTVNEVIYFDHKKENVECAKKLGICSVIYKDPQQVKEFLQNNLYSLKPLKQKNVDTGMGMERTLAVLSGEKSVYETGLFQPMIKKVEEISKVRYNVKKREIRIIVDHLRAAVFILGDQNGVVPSNLDRGYILRRLIRRAIRFGKLISIKKTFIPDVALVVIQEYGRYYHELKDNANKILSELKQEEEKFSKTLEKGLKEFNKMAGLTDVISGKDAFLLFQSYGFPLEMTQELALEQGVTVDEAVFKEEFEKHQNLSRTSTAGKFKGGLADSSPVVTRMHTATHLLNEALRRVISEKIRQRGSNITPERLRFDFSFDRKLTSEEIKKVEDEVNRVIKGGLEVKREEMSKDEAVQIGAQMEFGAKYPERVSVYFVGDYSKEFCGGPHVKNTKDIGKFKILKEESSSAGARRIKAVVETL